MNAACDRDSPWDLDEVRLSTGVVVPVRATARRRRWRDLPDGVRRAVEVRAGSPVIGDWSAGTGFTPGFASRLDLANGERIFVKAASTSDDALHGWPMSDAYREEHRKLTLLPQDIGAPPLLWDLSLEDDGHRWIVLCFSYVDGRPPRRPWRQQQLTLVLDRIEQLADVLTPPPPELVLKDVADHLNERLDQRLDRVRAQDGRKGWVNTIGHLARQAPRHLRGSTVVHMDLRDDNVLIGADGRVWFVDWNWPVVGAPWIDLVCILLSARGDGLDVDALLATHPLTADVDPEAINCLLAVLLSFWIPGMHDDVPHGSPHLRDHQAWYAEVTEDWLRHRLGLPSEGQH